MCFQSIVLCGVCVLCIVPDTNTHIIDDQQLIVKKIIIKKKKKKTHLQIWNNTSNVNPRIISQLFHQNSNNHT